jgi:hypothetical protein
MAAKQRLGFPTKFAKEQNTYEVKDGTKMFLFDHVSQFIYRVSFKLGQVSGDGLDEYVSKNYSAVEKKFLIDNYDILFARRDFRGYPDTTSDSTKTWFCQVNDSNLSDQTKRWNVDHESYIFLNDQLMYDPQLGETAFKNKKMIGINTTVGGAEYPVSVTSLNNDATKNQLKVEKFDTYKDQRTLANTIMKDKTWIKRFAQKHFLMIFRSNNVMPDPRIFYGFPIKSLRYHPYDQVKY